MNKSGPRPKPFECRSDLFWYLVGLIATDGCLLAGRHVVVTSSDQIFLEQLQRALGGIGRIRQKQSGYGTIGYDYYLGGVTLYRKLLVIGLTPRKSLTLGALNIPDAAYHNFFRGVIDGDGNIRRWVHPSNQHEQWELRIFSVSKAFVTWLHEMAQRLWQVQGVIIEKPRANEKHHMMFVLKFGKLASKVILSQCYYRNAVALQRKARLAEACIAATVGWSRSQTVMDSRRWEQWTYSHQYPRAASGSSRVADGHAISFKEYMCDGTTAFAGVAKVAKATDLKSVGRKALPVRVRPPALVFGAHSSVG